MCSRDHEKKNSSGQIQIVGVIAAVTAESIVKIRPENISTMTTLCLDLGVKGYVEEWLKWHGSHINPCELKAVIGWFGELNSLVDKKRPLTRLNIMKVHYNTETAEKNMRPTADSARHISVPDLNSYAKGDNGAKVETMLMDNRRKAEKVLQDLVGEGASTRYLEKFEMNLISLLFAKKLDASSFDTTGCVGKYSEAKAEQMVVNWAKWLETRSEALKGFAEKVGIDINDGDDGKVAPLDVTMEAANFENHEFQASMNTECIAAGLVVGAHVKLARRITCLLYTSPSPRDQRGSRMPSSA